MISLFDIISSWKVNNQRLYFAHIFRRKAQQLTLGIVHFQPVAIHTVTQAVLVDVCYALHSVGEGYRRALFIALAFHIARSAQLAEHLAADLSFLLRSWGLRGRMVSRPGFLRGYPLALRLAQAAGDFPRQLSSACWGELCEQAIGPAVELLQVIAHQVLTIVSLRQAISQPL